MRVKKAKEKLESDLMEAKLHMEDKDITINNLTGLINEHVRKTTKLENEGREQKINFDKLLKENEANITKLAKLQDDYNNTLYELDKSKKVYQERLVEIKVKHHNSSN